jgi:hypothetical protein
MSLLVSIFELVGALALTTGVFVGIVQLRQHAIMRRREAMLELVRSFRTADMTNAMAVVLRRGAELGRDEFREFAHGDGHPFIVHLGVNFSALGALVHSGEVDLDLVASAFGGAIRRCWGVLRPQIEESRQQLGWPGLYEWFQWLAERIEERDLSAPRGPAYEAFRDWKSATPRRPR